MLSAALELGISYLDTAPWYGCGLAELRVGSFLREAESRADSMVISTKVGRWFHPRDDRPAEPRWKGGFKHPPHMGYKRDDILRSFDQSLLRMGVDSVDLLAVHDLDHGYHGTQYDEHFRDLADSGAQAMMDLRDAGYVTGVGIAVNGIGYVGSLFELAPWDFVVAAGPVTLLESQFMAGEGEIIREAGASIIVGSPLQSGVLTGSKGSDRARSSYKYRQASAELLDRVRRIESVCHEFEVTIMAAAIQYPFRFPHVASVIAGPRTLEQLRGLVDSFEKPIPQDLWDRLETVGLIARSV